MIRGIMHTRKHLFGVVGLLFLLMTLAGGAAAQTPILDYNPGALSSVADGTAVASLPDSQGTGNALAQATGAKQPLYYNGTNGTHAINGLPVLSFTGTQYLDTPVISYARPITIFLVCRINDAGLNEWLGPTGLDQVVTNNGPWTFGNSSSVRGHRVETGLHIIEATWTTTTRTLTIDGQTAITASASNTTLTKIELAGDGNGNFPAHLDLARMQVYGALSGAQAASLRQSLATAYGISLVFNPSVARTLVTGTSGTTSQAYTILVPSGYSAGTPAPVVIFTPGGSQNAASLNTDRLETIVADAFLAQGFICAESDSHGWASNANNAELADQLDLYNIIHAAYNTGKVYFVGTSRGGLTALVSLVSGNFPVGGFVGIYPLCSLSYWYSGNSAEVNTAYNIPSGGTYAAQTAGHDPLLLSASAFNGLPMRFYASPSDTTVTKSANSDAMASLVTGHAKESVVVAASGLHGDPSHYQYGDVYAFLGRALRLTLFRSRSSGGPRAGSRSPL